MKKTTSALQLLPLIAATILATALPASSLTIPPTLRDEITGRQIADGTRNLVICIHGWNPSGKADKYTEAEWDWLVFNMKQALPGSSSDPWALLLYHWETDANTGFIDWPQVGYYWQATANAATAGQNGWEHGISLGARLPSSLRKVHIIAHSAGAWCAYQTASALLANPYTVVQVTLLDPYIPDEVPGLHGSYPTLSKATIDGMANWPSGFSTRFSLLENYFADDSVSGTIPNFPANIIPAGVTFGTQTTFSWRAQDINLQVDWSFSAYPYRTGLADLYYDWHSGPVLFYGDTIEAENGGTIEPGLPSGGLPFDYNLNGWKRGLFYRFQSGLMTRFTAQPQRTTSVASGTSVTLSVGATSLLPFTFQWFKRGQDAAISGATFSYYTFTASSATAGDYVVRLLDSGGNVVFSDFATVNVTDAPPPTAAPSIASVSPSTLPPSYSTQLINIYGSNFKATGDANASTLIFRDPANIAYVRTPIVVSSSQLQFNITVQSAVGTWSVTVTNAGLAASNLKTFLVQTPPPNTGSLTVNLFPAGAVSAGAQWQVDGGSYRNSGDTATGLAPGSHNVSFKSVSGYTTPAGHSVSIASGGSTTDSGTYTVVTASTFTLTLNYDPAQGGASPSPLVPETSHTYGSYSFGYTAGSVTLVQASASSGYHFTGWSGDLSGTANPAPITMSANRSVTANFASGDPNMGTVIVTIQPPAAAAAGVKWGWNVNDFRDSGTSDTSWPGGYWIVLHTVDGWLGPPVQSITVTAGQTANYTATFTPDTTPGLLTVTLSPPDAVTAGAKWHVNGGAAQGSGATVSLPPGTNYVLTYDPVPGWTRPLSQTVTVQRAQTVIAAGIYTPPAGQPVIGSISPPLGSMSGGTVLTIGGVNFATPASVLIGGQPATSVTVVSPGLLTCVAPSTSAYGTVPVVLQTSGGTTTNLNGFAYGMTLGKKVSLVGSVGGSAFGVAVQGNYVYVGEGRSLLVLDISTPSSPSKVGKVVLPGVVMDVAVFGQYAYVAALEGGLQVVKISNPAAPSICGFYSTTNRASAEGIAILGGLAYVADDYAGLQIFDLANPVVPALLSSTNFGDGVGVKVKTSGSGVLAYVSTGGGLCVLDVSQPSSPVLLGQTAVGDNGIYGSIALYGNSVIGPTTDGTIHMIDVSQPSAPKDLTLKTGDNGTGGYSQVAVAGNYLYAESFVSGLGFTVFSISGTNLTRVGRNGNVFSPGGYYQKMLISGSRAYVAAGSTGLQIVDVSSPSSPLSVAAFSDSGSYGNYGAVGMTGNYLCIGAGDFKVFNVSQPSQPLLVGQLSGIGASKVVAANGVAYATANNNVIDVISIGAGSPQIVGNIPFSVVYATRLALAGNILYAVGNNTLDQPRFVAVDVSNPLSPTVRATKDFTSSGTGMARGVAASGTKAVVAIRPYSGGQPMLSFLDISNLSAPTERGSLANVNAQDLRISVDGNYVFVNDYVSGGLLVINISSLSSPLLVTNITVDSSWFTGMDIRGNELFVTTGKGLYVFDISNPAAPALARIYAVTYIFGGVCAPGDTVGQGRNVYLGDSDGGIVVLKEDDIQAPNIYITNPTFLPVYTNATSTLNLGGGSDDDSGVTRVAWSNSRGGGGEVSSPFDNWFVSGIRLLPGTNALTATAFDQAGNSASDTLTVIFQATNQNQTITFAAIADQTFGDAPIPLVAAASSGLPVSFSVASGPASLAGNLLTLTGADVVTVQANQPGNASFNPATPVQVSFNVARANQSVVFSPVSDKSVGDAPFVLSATASSGLPVIFAIVSGPAAVVGNLVTLSGAGTVTVRASQSGNINFNAALDVERSFVVAKLPQFITFGALSRQVFGDAPFALSASASSGLPVSFSILSGPAIVSGNILTMTGAGLVVLRASQSGDANSAPAPNVDQVLIVVPGINVITDFERLANGMFTFRFYGEPGTNCVQASTNLVNWLSLSTNQVGGLGYLEFTDFSATNYSRRFYRIAPWTSLP